MYWQTLLWPFRTAPLITIATYTLVAGAFTAWAEMNFWVAVMVLSLGLPVWFSVFGMLSLYAEKILTQAATGLFDERIESEADLNPFERGMALKLFAAHLVVFVILFYNGPELGFWLLIPAALFPLIWLSVVLDESLLGGFRPQHLKTVVGGLNIYYPVAMLLASGSVGYLHYSLLYASTLVNIVASAFIFLEANVLFGLLLYHCRWSLNLQTAKSPEQTRAEELEAESRLQDELFHELHRHMANGSYDTAISKLEAFISQDPELFDPLMHARLLEFQDSRLCLEHAVRYLQRLVEKGELRKAWTLMKECLHMDVRFRPPSDTTTMALTRSASREDAGLVNNLLADFDSVYPGSQLIPDALFRRARINIEILNDGHTGLNLVSLIASEHPEFAATEPFQRYRRRLKIQ